MVDTRNAIILAAGTSSRFVPLSQERPKGLLEVKGEILIERQIRQLLEAGISDVTLVTGYKAEMFDYLRTAYGVSIIYNEDYAHYNNTSSLIRVIDRLSDTYICSSDNYFTSNVFLERSDESYYSSLYAEGPTDEYCLACDDDGYINNVSIGGKDSWYMVGHVYFSKEFSNAFRDLMLAEYTKEEIRHRYWEDVYINHIDTLPRMKINRYDQSDIMEFDSLDELRKFDRSYLYDTRCDILKDLASKMNCSEADLCGFSNIPGKQGYAGFIFNKSGIRYLYDAHNRQIRQL